MGEQFRACDVASNVVVVGVGDGAAAERPEQRAQRKCLVCDFVLFDRDLDFESSISSSIDDGREAFAEPPWTSEQINYGDGALPCHSFLFSGLASGWALHAGEGFARQVEVAPRMPTCPGQGRPCLFLCGLSVASYEVRLIIFPQTLHANVYDMPSWR